MLALIWLNLFLMLQPEWEINEQYSYGYLVPLIGAYLVYLRWQCRPRTIPRQPSHEKMAGGLIVGALAIFLPCAQIIYQANPDWRMLYWAHALLVMSVTLPYLYIMGGSAWMRHFAPAFAMFLFAVPWPTLIEQPMVQQLMRLVAAGTVEMLNLYGLRAVQEGNLIHLSNMPVGVEEACSGVRSLQSNIMAAYFFGELYRFRVGMRILLLALGIPLAILINLMRTLTLTLFAHYGGAEMLTRWHDTAGNVAAVSGFLLLLLIAWLLTRYPRSTASPAASSATLPHGRPIRALWLGGIATIVAASHAGAAAWFGLHEEDSQRRYHVEVNWEALNRDISLIDIKDATRALLRYSEGTHAIWRTPSGGSFTTFFFSWDAGVLSSFAGVHRPEVCLPAAGFVKEATLEDWVWDSGQGLVIPFQRLRFSNHGKPVFVYFAVWNNDANTLDTEIAMSASERLEQALSGKRVGERQQLEFVLQRVNEQEAQQAVERFMSKAVRVATRDPQE